MKSIWKISYKERDKGKSVSSVDLSTTDYTVRVVAQTAEQAIARLRNKKVGRKFTWGDDDGKMHTETVEELLLVGLTHEGCLDG